ncbi:PAS sensor protein [Halobiforma lacisalsi AJ5]|uniref:histidine kinase n=1 Tax=Natronobacterium lacisalsi AJ5 TaxID=358396 RepID=M0LPS8_NATLA|nr:PAS domain-containing protein [Halobiforma lacisalsi]APW97196.1 PAS sensor protein [Halobiforma lacisalsi AJ5]EMA34030.1 PAS/PAC sensor protein [Halobiforma lacisalsi AJ5]
MCHGSTPHLAIGPGSRLRNDRSARSARPGRFGRDWWWLAATVALAAVAVVGGLESTPAVDLHRFVAIGPALPFPALPAVLGLAAGGSDRFGPLERLTDDVRTVSDALEDAESVADAERRFPAVDAELERDDELGELSAAVDDLAAVLDERVEQLAANERSGEALDRIASDADLEPEETIRRLLEVGRERLGVEAGFVVRRDPDRGRYEVLIAEGSEVVPEGAHAPIEREHGGEPGDCTGGTVEFTDGTGAELEVTDGAHPICGAWDDRGVEWAAGGRIDVDGEPYGTVCFVDREPREAPFTGIERTFVDRVRRRLSHVLERREYVRELRLKTRTLEYAPIGVTITDPDEPDNPIVYANEEFERLTGYSPAEYLGRNCRFLQGEETDPERIGELREAVEAAEQTTVELRNYRADGTPFWNRVTVTPLEDEDGAVTHFVGFQEDVTERKRRDRELREREQELSTLMDNVPGMVYRCRNEPDWPFEFVSGGAEEITGYEPAELVEGDVNWGRDVLVENRDDLWDDVQRALENREPYRVTYRIETADGERRWLSEQGRGVFDEDGQLAHLEGAIVDITEQVENERALERTRGLLEQAQRIAGVGGWELDVREDEHEVTWTEETARIHGLPPGTVADLERGFEGLLDYYHPEDRPQLEDAIERAIEDGEPYDLELRLIRADGEQRWVRTIGEPIADCDRGTAARSRSDDHDGGVVKGDVDAVRGSIQDITAQKEREHDLERTRAFLERIQKLADIGGWELDMRTDPRTPTWTDELFRLHGMPREDEPDLWEAIDQYHPDDRPKVREALESAIESETIYDLEARLQPEPGEIRWVRGFGAPIFEDGELVKYQGALQDITDRKERELALESLHEVARGLLGTETVEDVAELVVEATDDLLDASGVALYGLDPDVNRLVPIAHTEAYGRLSSDDPSAAVGNGDSVLWNAFVTGAQTVVDDAAAFDRSEAFETGVETAVVVPIGDHGVFAVASDGEPIDVEARRLIETLGATTEAALDRLESEANLRERDAELEARNRRLRRQITINETIRRINQSLIGATSRAEIERTVPEQLVAVEEVAFAWIGRPGPDGESLEPRGWAGDGEEYLDLVSLDAAGAGDGDGDGSIPPAVRTASSEGTTVVENVVEDLQRESWRKRALEAGFQSVIGVPLAVEDYSYGVLTVYATEPDAFTDLERTVFAELGEAIANAITATKTREALHAETVVELTLEMTDATDVLSRIASLTDARVEYEGLGTHSDSGEEALLFFETRGADPDAVAAVLEDLVSVSEYRLLSTGGDDGDGNGDEDGGEDRDESDPDANRCRFEALVTGPVIASRLVRHGGSPRSILADGDETVVTVDVPAGTDVREFVETLADHTGDAELRRRRHVERALQTRRELVTSLFDALTDRQLEVLRTAYFAGFFEWPRESTGQEVAEALGVSQPTVNRHLRIGQQRLLRQLFEDGTVAVGE